MENPDAEDNIDQQYLVHLSNVMADRLFNMLDLGFLPIPVDPIGNFLPKSGYSNSYRWPNPNFLGNPNMSLQDLIVHIPLEHNAPSFGPRLKWNSMLCNNRGYLVILSPPNRSPQ